MTDDVVDLAAARKKRQAAAAQDPAAPTQEGGKARRERKKGKTIFDVTPAMYRVMKDIEEEEELHDRGHLTTTLDANTVAALSRRGLVTTYRMATRRGAAGLTLLCLTPPGRLAIRLYGRG